MGKLEEFYGVAEAQRIRAQQGYGAAPTPTEVTQLTPEMKQVLKERMTAIIAAEEYARQKGLSLAQTVSIASVLPLIGPFINFITSPVEGRAAVVNFFQTVAVKMVSEGAAGMDRVLAGTESFDHWLAARKVDIKGMTTMLAALGDNTLASNLGQTISDVGNDVSNMIQWFAKQARDLPKNLPDTKTSLYLALAVGLFIVYQYATAPLRVLPGKQLSGYSRPRRRRLKRRR